MIRVIDTTYLLTLSGFHTGNVCNSRILRSHGFEGEGIKDGSVVAIKTHLRPASEL